MRIGDKTIGGADAGIYVIAEIGGNHNGDPERAYRMVEEAARTGADAVKFQSYRAESLVHPDMEAVPIARRFYKTQYERFRSLQLSDQVYARLIEQCRELGVHFMTTPYDLEILERFAPQMPAVKIASGDATYHGLIRAAAATGKPVILSTGFCNMAEVEAAAVLIPGPQRVLLHCVSIYPLPDNAVNLNAIPRLMTAFPDSVVGFSDHTIGPEACLAAVGLGAEVLEKHFTLDRGEELGDHRLSLEPDQLADMVAAVRRIAVMRGSGDKPSPGEELLREKFRRGVYAARDLPEGHVIRTEDLLCIRPLGPIGAEKADTLLGRRLKKAIAARRPIAADSVG